MTTSGQLLYEAHGEATRLLGERFGDVQLDPPALIKDTTRTVVGRAAVLEGALGVDSVVVKVIRDDPATGCTEWASLAFLDTRPILRGVVPASLGGVLASPPLFVMEDLGHCLAHIAAVYREPGPWLCFSHGDPAPSNTHITGDEVRLLDFEYGGFRHALYDLSAWAVLCPLPERQLQQMRDMFQHTLADFLPAAGDSGAFRDGWGALCAYRAIALLSWVSPAVLESDQAFVGAWSARQAVLAALARAEAAAAPVPALRPAVLAFRRLYGELHQRWPEAGAMGGVPSPWLALDAGRI